MHVNIHKKGQLILLGFHCVPYQTSVFWKYIYEHASFPGLFDHFSVAILQPYVAFKSLQYNGVYKLSNGRLLWCRRRYLSNCCMDCHELLHERSVLNDFDDPLTFALSGDTCGFRRNISAII